MTPPLSAFEKNPEASSRRLIQRAHLQDELPEIAVGLTLLTCSVAIYIQRLLEQDRFVSSQASSLTGSLPMALPIFVCIVSARAMFWVRKRYLLRQEGYVEIKPWSRGRLVLYCMAVLLVGMASGEVVSHLAHPERGILAGAGLLAGTVAALLGKVPRFVIAGILFATLGIGLAIFDVSLIMGLVIFLGTTGLLSLLSGSVALFRLVRRPADADE